jgi:hypothetical protein
MTAVQQQQVNSHLDVTILTWNPPTLFIFLLPLAWMSFNVAKFTWLIVNITIVFTAGLMLTSVYLSAASPRAKFAFLIFAMGFPAVLNGIYMGQITFLVFWGLTACMTLIRKEQWFWAGAVLIFTTVKPHIAVLPIIYLLIYMLINRKFVGWIGLATAAGVCILILLLFRSSLLFDLSGATTVANVRWATSTIGGLLSYFGITEAARYLILLFLPLPFVLAKYSEKISMELSVALLTLITVPTTVFGWSYDQTILLIPIAQVFGWLTHSKYKWWIAFFILSALIINYYQRILTINETYYVWVPLFWCILFGLMWRNISLMVKNHA